MRVMTIDIGTNSTLYLVADVAASKIKVIERGIEANSLGADINPDGSIDMALLAKNRRILMDLVAKSRELKCSKIVAAGTQALRQCSNSGDFISMAASVGIPLKIISSDAEASLTWRGVFGNQEPREKTGLIDLGGGSTELITGGSEQLVSSVSVPVGAVNLSRKFFKHDPPAKGELIKAERYVSNEFDHWERYSHETFKLTGAAGTITALAAINPGVTLYRSGSLEGLRLTRDEISDQRKKLSGMNLQQRSSVPGMPVARAASIHAGALILDVIMGLIGKKALIVTERGVLFGLAHEIQNEDCNL